MPVIRTADVKSKEPQKATGDFGEFDYPEVDRGSGPLESRNAVGEERD